MANNPKKYASDNTLSAVVAKIKELFVKKTDLETALSNKADSSHTHLISNVTNLQSTLDGKVPTSRTINSKPLSANITLSASDVGAATSTHSHDDLYYTESEMDTKLAGKADTTHKHDDYAAKTHNHDGVYAVEGHNHDGKYDAKGSASAVQTNLNTVSDALDDHTTNSDIHFTAAERTKLSGIAAGAQVNTITGVKGNSETSYRTGDVNITKANIGLGNVDNTSDANKPISTAQQTAFDAVNDAIGTHTENDDIHVTTTNKSNWNAAYNHSQAAHARTDATKVEDSSTNGNIKINGTETNVYSHPTSGVSAGTYKSVTVNAQGHVTGGSNPTTLSGYGITDAETKSDASSKLTEAKTYADNAANTVKNDLLNNAGAAYDTLKELGDLIDDNKDAIDALEEIASGKANVTHIHAISDVTNLQSTLDGKANSSHGTHVTYSTTAPVMDGTASVGTASTVARSDHKHPTDTSRASKTEFDSHSSDTTKHITSTERTNWNAAKTHADSAHAPSDAQKNQNAFSNIAVSGQTTVTADTATDTLTLVGSNVSITTDATNDKVTLSVADGTTSAKGVVQLTDSTSSTSTTTAATPKNVKAAYDLANTAKTDAATAQSRADAAYSLAESKADSLSDLGITATATELNYVGGVTSNVQTQLDNKLSTSGGTISGIITTTDGDVVNRNITTSGTYFYGGTNFDDGAFIGLYGKDQSNYAGQFRLKADDGSSFVYLEGRPDGQLRWDNKNIVTVDSNGAVAIADGGTGARSSSGALANLGGVPLAGGTMTGALKVPQLAATSTSAYIGSMTTPFQQVYTKSVYVQDGVNDTVSYGDFRAQTTGTTSVVGKTQLSVGNSTASGKAGNSRGIVKVYGTKAYCHQIQGDASANRTLTLPDKTGTLATTADLASLASVATLTQAEYTALEQAEATNANTLYMITDAEEEIPGTQVQFVIWEKGDTYNNLEGVN